MKKRLIAVLLAMTALLCTAGCGEEKDKCAECGKTSDETFLFEHDDGNLYCAGCRDVPVKVG